MFKVKNLTVKNFMSVGNSTQAVQFNRKDLTLVLGQNLDLGGDDTGARNGTGKTTIINALSYALYGEALTKIRKDNLINKTNGKNMLVTIEFENNGLDYKIERGRKPNTVAFYIGGKEQEITDESQGDSRETQAEIERMLNMSHDMFKHIVALNTYTEPFLSLRANDQRTIIEQLLGITMLSEKADVLKEQLKQTKSNITEEEYRIKAVQNANERIKEQIEATRRRQTMWQNKKQEQLDKLSTAVSNLDGIDIEVELAAHDALDLHSQTSKAISEVSRWRVSGEQESTRLEKHITSLTSEIAKLEKHECYACGQTMHDNKHEEVLDKKRITLTETEQQYHESQEKVQTQVNQLAQLGNPGPIPIVFYDSKEDAINHKATIENLTNQLETKLKESDPYEEQIVEMETQAVQEISYDHINALTSTKEHEDFLLKLLTNKDSFIRKRIIDQNLSYLNVRLIQYLDKIGLPHTVQFNNDLTVSIEELGRELDFDNLSRGERNRLILSMSWAFRDVWESLYQQINLMFIDEVIDTGMDASGVESSLAILKKMAREGNRSVWLVSHKDELAGRVNNVLSVVKENGFTSYNNDVEIS